jgi:hypothetical protein
MRSTFVTRAAIACGLFGLAATTFGLAPGTASASVARPELRRLTTAPQAHAATTPLQSPTRVVPVTFVVVHRGGDGLLSRQQLVDRLAELEAAWGGSRVRFVLADALAVDAADWFHLAPGSSRERAAMSAVSDAGYGAARYLRIVSGEPVDQDGDELPGYAAVANWEGGRPGADGVVLSWRLLADGSPANRAAVAGIVAEWLGEAPAPRPTRLAR